MDIKLYLRQYGPALRYAQRCFRDLDDARDVRIQSPRLDGMPRGGGGNGIDDQMARIDLLERRAATAREKALDLAEAIERIINAVDDHEEKTVLSLRYLQCLTWDEVASRAGYSSASVRRIHGRALQKLRGRWEDDRDRDSLGLHSGNG